jgi:hypothetical protein
MAENLRARRAKQERRGGDGAKERRGDDERRDDAREVGAPRGEPGAQQWKLTPRRRRLTLTLTPAALMLTPAAPAPAALTPRRRLSRASASSARWTS